MIMVISIIGGFMTMLRKNNYTPDVLECLANLSSDEVFTPPEVANKILDMLPQEVFESTETTFLDPFSKSGVFLREITKRLLKGQVSDYDDKSKEIELIEKSAIQDAVKNGLLDLTDGEYELKAKKIGRDAIRVHPKASEFYHFEDKLQSELNRIFTNQIFGIAITELTAQLSRRSLYCSKDANGSYSVCTSFGINNDGNIRFVPMKHTWQNNTCIFCGGNRSKMDRPDDHESHAYEFIHTKKVEELYNMKFTVICGNPPYQLNLGNDGGNSAKAQAIYHKFIDNAIALKPKYLTMIIPSRWMTRTQAGVPDNWVDKMIACNHFKEIHDFANSAGCFPGVNINGGVNYFLYEDSYNGKCKYFYYDDTFNSTTSHEIFLNEKSSGVVIRDPKSYGVIEKISLIDGVYYNNEDSNFSGYVSPADFFTKKPVLTSNWSDFVSEKDDEHSIKCYLNKSIHKVPFGYIDEKIIPKNSKTIGLHKVYLAAANGTDQIIGCPFYGEPGSICSQTYRIIGYDPDKHNFTKEQCENIISYIKTRFFRYLVSIKKKTQNGPRGVYQFVPVQDFSKPWTDEELYKKYNLSESEIALIELNIKPMANIITNTGTNKEV